MHHDQLADEFQAHRARLRAVAYRMLGSPSEAEDAVQEAWLRLSRSDDEAIDNLGGWLTTVVARVALDMLRARTARREEYVGSWLPEPVVEAVDDASTPEPEREVLMADAVGLALLVVLDTLAPKERLAFVLHDMFGMPFSEIAPIVDRTPDATRQLASRARRRVRGAPAVDADLPRQRELVDAFLAAAREGDFDALVAVLDPDVVFRHDAGGGVAGRPRHGASTDTVVGAERVARNAVANGKLFLRLAHPATVNGGAGLIIAREGRTIGVAGITIAGDKIVEIDLVTDPDKLPNQDA
ncbi:ECF RNA polymerase sigma factor SigJ [Baekduia alba]|nr:RNA polymerase sigma factor SigJ [Baekduia alba]WCB96286.1 ECF RNA polymerase sigma factor SigJ [Baekduia alba]